MIKFVFFILIVLRWYRKNKCSERGNKNIIGYSYKTEVGQSFTIYSWWGKLEISLVALYIDLFN